MPLDHTHTRRRDQSGGACSRHPIRRRRRVARVEPGKLYGSAAGGIAAGALIVTRASNRLLRSLIKENRAQSRELMIDDLSGPSNGERSVARTSLSIVT